MVSYCIVFTSKDDKDLTVFRQWVEQLVTQDCEFCVTVINNQELYGNLFVHFADLIKTNRVKVSHQIGLISNLRALREVSGKASGSILGFLPPKAQLTSLPSDAVAIVPVEYYSYARESRVAVEKVLITRKLFDTAGGFKRTSGHDPFGDLQERCLLLPGVELILK